MITYQTEIIRATILDRMSYWACIALGHPSASDDELMRLAHEIDLSAAELSRLAAFIDRFNIFINVRSAPIDGQPLIETDNYNGFQQAAVCGHLHYYRAQANGGIDLTALARDRESSLHQLTMGEENRLAAAAAHYKTIMQAAGVGHLFDQLRAAPNH